MNENTPTFTPAARAELLAMYTGMAMQGLVQRGAGFSAAHIGSQAVAQASATVDALEAYHVTAALEESAAMKRAHLAVAANERAADIERVTPGASDVASSN